MAARSLSPKQIQERLQQHRSTVAILARQSAKRAEGGHWKPERVVIIEFPDMDTLDAWYNSPEYQPLIALRKSCTSDQDMLFVLEGA
jgi:uncharacterized protein (DUF1330 family)